MIVETNIDQLKPGMFIKTRGARDRVGLRKIVEIKWNRWADRYELFVDHYRFEPVMHQGKRRFRAVRKPYCSEVLADKVQYIYKQDEDGLFCGKEKFNYYKD